MACGQRQLWFRVMSRQPAYRSAEVSGAHGLSLPGCSAASALQKPTILLRPSGARIFLMRFGADMKRATVQVDRHAIPHARSILHIGLQAHGISSPEIMGNQGLPLLACAPRCRSGLQEKLESGLASVTLQDQNALGVDALTSSTSHWPGPKPHNRKNPKVPEPYSTRNADVRRFCLGAVLQGLMGLMGLMGSCVWYSHTTL